MNICFRVFIAATLMFFSSNGRSQEISSNEIDLVPFRADYVAYRWGDKLGEASMELEQLAPNKYSLLYQSKVSLFFLSDKRSEHSIFDVVDGSILAGEYHYKRSGTGKNKSMHVTFNRDEKSIVADNGKENWGFEWHGELDNQLYRLLVAHKLKQSESNFSLSFINYRGEQKQYTIETLGQESLEVPYGKLDSLKVKIKRENSRRETFAWFAPSLDYLLVRLQQFKDDEEQGDIRLSAHVQPSN